MEGDEKQVEEEDIVCLDASFFMNDDYLLTTFTFGEQVLQLYCLQSASTDFDLTGQIVWPGAMLMNDYLLQNSQLLKGCSVLELGSGVGITGILCSRFCREVVMTDHNDEVLKIIEKNIELHANSEESTCCAGLTAEKLEWGNCNHIDTVLQRHPEGFDIILGADSSIPLLFGTVKKLLQSGGKRKCIFVLAYVSRAKSLDNMIINEARQRGMQMEEVNGTRSVVGNLGGVIYEIILP